MPCHPPSFLPSISSGATSLNLWKFYVAPSLACPCVVKEALLWPLFRTLDVGWRTDARVLGQRRHLDEFFKCAGAI